MAPARVSRFASRCVLIGGSAIVSFVVVVQRNALREAKRDNLVLAARIVAMERQNARDPAARLGESEADSQGRRDDQELLRLRGEVARLRAEKSETHQRRAENQQLRDLIGTEND